MRTLIFVSLLFSLFNSTPTFGEAVSPIPYSLSERDRNNTYHCNRISSPVRLCYHTLFSEGELRVVEEALLRIHARLKLEESVERCLKGVEALASNPLLISRLSEWLGTDRARTENTTHFDATTLYVTPIHPNSIEAQSKRAVFAYPGQATFITAGKRNDMIIGLNQELIGEEIFGLGVNPDYWAAALSSGILISLGID